MQNKKRLNLLKYRNKVNFITFANEKKDKCDKGPKQSDCFKYLEYNTLGIIIIYASFEAEKQEVCQKIK